MALTNLTQLLEKAQKGRYAIGAFNVENMEMAQAVIWAAEEMHAPVILQTTPSTLKHAEPEVFFANISAIAKKATVPVVVHLDHGNSFEIASKAFREGYTSIMIDGSKYELEENIRITKAVVAMCRPSNVSVEAELGRVGGKEDSLTAEDVYTIPGEAKYFAEQTAVDALAVAIGTAHGIYKAEPKVDIERLKEIRKVVEIPLVLHGTSGVPDDVVVQCIENGICKVNYATDLRVAFTQGVVKVLSQDSTIYDPKKYMAAARENVKKYVMEKIKVCNCAGKADD